MRRVPACDTVCKVRLDRPASREWINFCRWRLLPLLGSGAVGGLFSLLTYLATLITYGRTGGAVSLDSRSGDMTVRALRLCRGISSRLITRHGKLCRLLLGRSGPTSRMDRRSGNCFLQGVVRVSDVMAMNARLVGRGGKSRLLDLLRTRLPGFCARPRGAMSGRITLRRLIIRLCHERTTSSRRFLAGMVPLDR